MHEDYGIWVTEIYLKKPKPTLLGAGCSFHLDWIKGRTQVCVQLNLGRQHA